MSENNSPLGFREWEGLKDIAKWRQNYRYRQVTMLKLEVRGLVRKVRVVGKIIYWEITDTGRAALKERRAV